VSNEDVGGSESIALRVRKLGSRWGWAITFTPRSL